MMKTTETEFRSHARHVPSAEAVDDDGEAMRQRAAESCGFSMGLDLEESRAELKKNGGSESIVRNAVRRIEREK